VHSAKGGNLYRVAADDRGRILASWENEAVFHLFVPATREHRTFAKPVAPPKAFLMFALDDLYFDEGGQDALVYMGGFDGKEFTLVAYRYPLDGKRAPTELFRQAGYQLHSTARLTVFAVPREPRRQCDYNACALASVVAWEISDAGAGKKVLFTAGKREIDLVRLVWGSDRERVAIIVSERSGARTLLRWRPGEAQAELCPIPKAPRWDSERTWLTRSGDVLEVWINDEHGMDIWRHGARGELKTTSLPPLPLQADGYKAEFGVHGFKERKQGGFFLHWGDYLFLLADGAPARAVSLTSFVKGSPEWAGAAIYVPEPEALWLGIEGGGRQFVYLALDEVEKLARPLPPSGQ
jgi:hypothetical protein